MKLTLNLIWVLILSLVLVAGDFALAEAKPKRPSREHVVYFAGTPNELSVYQVYGAQDGKTLMLLGGIQGDEPGGFLSADLYTDISLLKGNLIVVPRANFYSIIMNHRGPDGDMNRQFGDPVTARRHKKIIKILKELMAQADLLLNLHDGSGFYRPTWEGPMANPKRYGQSLIADTDVYRTADGTILDLKGMALRVLLRVNAQIETPKYHILFNNHRTSAIDSLHKEQRKSATYYALTKCNIPAFGVESSKSLPSTALKIRHHNLVINSFMQDLGIVPESPGVKLARPLLKYLVIGINNQVPVVAAKGSTIEVHTGDRIVVLHIEANYERGLACDIRGVGSVNDLRQAFIIRKNTRVVVRKDHQEIGRVFIRVLTKQPAQRVKSKMLYFLVDVNGQRRVVADSEIITVIKGDRITLVELLSNLPNQSRIKVNFKGFAPPGTANLGEDRGFQIDTSTDLLKRYSRCPQGVSNDKQCYQVIASHGKYKLGSMVVEVAPARLQYVVLRRGQGQPLVYQHGETVRARVDERLEIIDLKTNVTCSEDLSFALAVGKKTVPLSGAVISTAEAPLARLPKATTSKGVKLVVMRHKQAIGHVHLQFGGSPDARE